MIYQSKHKNLNSFIHPIKWKVKCHTTKINMRLIIGNEYKRSNVNLLHLPFSNWDMTYYSQRLIFWFISIYFTSRQDRYTQHQSDWLWNRLKRISRLCIEKKDKSGVDILFMGSFLSLVLKKWQKRIISTLVNWEFYCHAYKIYDKNSPLLLWHHVSI